MSAGSRTRGRRARAWAQEDRHPSHFLAGASDLSDACALAALCRLVPPSYEKTNGYVVPNEIAKTVQRCHSLLSLALLLSAQFIIFLSMDQLLCHCYYILRRRCVSRGEG